MSPPLLAYPDPQLPFLLNTTAGKLKLFCHKLKKAKKVKPQTKQVKPQTKLGANMQL